MRRLGLSFILALFLLVLGASFCVEYAGAASPGMIAPAAGAVSDCDTDGDGFAAVDPLVAPGPDCFPSAHEHKFAGVGLESDTTFEEQMLGPTTFCWQELRSAGWWPQWTYAGVVTGRVIASSVGANGVSTAAAKSKGAAFYYRRKGIPNGQAVQAFPKGLAMILRDGATVNGRLVNFGTDPGGERDELGMKCGPGSAPYTATGLPPATCNTNVLSDVYVFPNCWNGWMLFPQDGISHMSYPVNNKCPAAFPVNIPRLEQFRRSIIPEYRFGAAVLDPNLFKLGGHTLGEPGVAHADYRPGFTDAGMAEFLTECINWRNSSGVIVGRDCGTAPSSLTD